MKKVGILTLYYKTYNYGAQLQAYALTKVLNNMGFDAEQIRFAWSMEHTRIFYENNMNKYEFEQFSDSIPHSSTLYTPSDLHTCKDKYDAFVCGSDQIWGVKESMPWFVLPQMALSFVPDHKKKIAYAGSFGAGLITQDRIEIIKDFLTRMDTISVREQSALPLAAKLSHKNILHVADPVILLSSNDWSDVADKGTADTSEPYLLLYNVSSDKEIHGLAERVCAILGVKLIDINYTGKASPGPPDFVKYIRDAEYIITDSFHGTALSIIFHKQFITFGVDNIDTLFSKNVRIKDLLETCGLMSRFALEVDETHLQLLKKTIDYHEVDKKVSDLTSKSFRFIQSSFENKMGNDSKQKGAVLLREKVVETHKCVGCGACTQSCNANCISIGKDKLGFWIPQFNADHCFDCGNCLMICPVYTENSNRNNNMPLSKLSRTVALRAKDPQVLSESSSGGAFALIAAKILAEGGIICGAAYKDDFSVSHICIEDISELYRLKKSKYIQSHTADVFHEVKEHLHRGRNVLFSGTPCQIAGLKGFLLRQYDNLFCLDVICGGVTAPALWGKYVDYYDNKSGGSIKNYDMRSKALGFFYKNGFLSFQMAHHLESEEQIFDKEKDYFLNSRYAYYRECCYHCDFKGMQHLSDMTIGDFVGLNLISPQEDNNRGVNSIITWTDKGNYILNSIRSMVDIFNHTYEDLKKYNGMLESCMSKPTGYDYIRNLATKMDIDAISLETDKIRLFEEKERLIAEKEKISQDFIRELKRNEQLKKLRCYKDFGLALDNEPELRNQVGIYGAGKVGKAVASCFLNKYFFFIDEYRKEESCCGHPIYKMSSSALGYMRGGGKDLTVIVTPVWDLKKITDLCLNQFPEANVISVDELVRNL